MLPPRNRPTNPTQQQLVVTRPTPQLAQTWPTTNQLVAPGRPSNFVDATPQLASCGVTNLQQRRVRPQPTCGNATPQLAAAAAARPTPQLAAMRPPNLPSPPPRDQLAPTTICCARPTNRPTGRPAPTCDVINLRCDPNLPLRGRPTDPNLRQQRPVVSNLPRDPNFAVWPTCGGGGGGGGGVTDTNLRRTINLPPRDGPLPPSCDRGGGATDRPTNATCVRNFSAQPQLVARL